MDKKWLLVVILAVLTPIAYSLTNVVVSETDLVAISPVFEDPDGDQVDYSYTYPLNEDGEWQTDYGDAGNYIVTITASDGDLITEEELIIVVDKKEEYPEIYSYVPEDAELYVTEGHSLHFKAAASDINKDELTYQWFFKDKLIGSGKEVEYYADYFDQGRHTIKIVVDDGTLKSAHEWTVNVEDVDRTKLLENITNLEIDETQSIKLELPDFEAYNLEYEISEPLGSENYWKTTYDDSGRYMLSVTIKDREFRYTKTVDLTVNNIDRKPIIEPISGKLLSEGEEVNFFINATDPDGDSVSVSMLDAPAGSELKNNVFKWTPDRDYVMKDSFFASLLDKFHLLNKAHIVTLVAESNDLSVAKRVKIRVFDDNRIPIIEDLEPVMVNEGEVAFIEPNAYDLDGDKLKVTYSGWTKKPTKPTGYEDAGEYAVTVRASDGKTSIEKEVTVIVNDVNRPPVIENIPEQEVNEGETLEFSISTSDPDNDLIVASVENVPSGSTFDENVFTWTPGYEETRKMEAKQYILTFKANDGELGDSKDASVIVHHVNVEPEIINVSPIVGKFGIYEGDSVIFQVAAEDLDEDELSYKWVFGKFNTYKGGPLHQRTFTRAGEKEVQVIISDGKKAKSVKWVVDVLERGSLQPMVLASIAPEPVVQVPVQQPVPQPVPQPTPQLEPQVIIQPVIIQQPTQPAPQPQPIQQPIQQPIPQPVQQPITYKVYTVVENV